MSGTTKRHIPAPNPEMVLIKAGRFVMGSPANEPGRDSYESQREVTIEKDFLMGKYEVTVGQYRSFCAKTGFRTEHERDGDDYDWDHPLSHMHQTDDHPVLAISWDDANAYCAWLSKETGDQYRLPTEVEWEYACRAGTTTAFNTGDTLAPSDAAYHGALPAVGRKQKTDNSLSGSVPVWQFKPNAFGLYDMHGNAFEWCADVFKEQEYTESLSGKYHTIRGGAWSMQDTTYCRSAHREGFLGGNGMTGFRIVKELKPDAAVQP
ncbi:MAG: formylglycine-generating enzyme family protein [Pirellulales bacterium]